MSSPPIEAIDGGGNEGVERAEGVRARLRVLCFELSAGGRCLDHMGED